MFVAWTTTASREDAERLAKGTVEQHLAACTQIDGPVKSFYHWQGKLQEAEEFRIWFKCLPTNAAALATWVHHHHPYSTPQWIVVNADSVGEKYLSWSMANSTSPPF